MKNKKFIFYLHKFNLKNIYLNSVELFYIDERYTTMLNAQKVDL